MKLKAKAAAVMMAVLAAAVPASAEVSNNINVSNTCVGENLNIYISGKDYETIKNNILILQSYIGGNVNIRIVSGTEKTAEKGDFRGKYSPKIY